MGGPIEVIRLPGLVAYHEALGIQQTRREDVENAHAAEALFLLEHTPVLTLGRTAKPEHVRASAEELAAMGVALHNTDRGGDVTYHGPGQLVAYPILDLRRRSLSVRGYLRALEQVLIALTAEYGIDAQRIHGLTGVWVDGAKIAAIGIAVHNGVTWHGIALNVDPCLAYFDAIVPCGIPDRTVTSLAKILGHGTPTVHQAMDDFQRHFLDYFGAASASSESSNVRVRG